MQGLSPRPHSLTPRQAEASAKIAEAVPEFPTSVADLISQMANTDYALAMREVELDDGGEVIQSERNQEIISYIELALTAPSTDCDPTIKAAIFFNASEHFRTGNVLRPFLGRIINRLSDDGKPINLDDVVMNDVDLSHAGRFNLSGMSAQRARFNHVILDYLKMENADFTEAAFSNTSLEWASISNATITDARFSNVIFKDTDASELSGNQSVIFDSCATCTEITSLDGLTIATVDKIYLKKKVDTAFPNRDNFVLPAHRIADPQPDVF